jgi:hypothetical protein
MIPFLNLQFYAYESLKQSILKSAPENVKLSSGETVSFWTFALLDHFLMFLLVRTEAQPVRTSDYHTALFVNAAKRENRETTSCIGWLKHSTISNTKDKIQPWTPFGSLQLISGGFAGSTAALFTTPFDVVKTRMQLQVLRQMHILRSESVYPITSDCD